VLIGRARRWSAGTVFVVSSVAAVLHTLLSVGLGLAALAVGLTAAQAIGETLERVVPPLLVAFGLLYAGWSWRKGAHFHPGGKLFHAAEPAPGCAGAEGHTHPEHLHYHADGGLIRGQAGWNGFALALIVGLNPCVLVLPLVLASLARGAGTLGLVLAAYSVPAVIVMVGLSVGGVLSSRRIRLPWAARHAETASGLILAALGFVLLLAEGG
jgi:ABC-type nickel/cobalt efflux system permease component RcnA